jgi:hypothetical protein
MGRWFLMLPDILVFFSIFGFGFLSGVITILIIVAYNVIVGNTLTITKEEF